MRTAEITELEAGSSTDDQLPSLTAPDTVVVVAPQSPYSLHRIRLRLLRPSDARAFKEMHYSCFPVDYEESYYRQAIYFEDSIVTWVAVEESPAGVPERMVGFIVFKTYPLYSCDPVDRKLLSLDSRLLDGELVAYILTLAVAPTHRKQGIASSLISKVLDLTTSSMPCRAIYLHVIQYNQAARRLYAASEFENLARLKHFYEIRTGRQPDPSQHLYDAYFYAKVLKDGEARLTATSLLYALAAPLRPMLKAFAPCAPALLAPSNGIQGGAPRGFSGVPIAPRMSTFGHSLKRAFA